mgnify:FL=1
MGFIDEVAKKTNVGFALLRFEYTKKSGDFDADKYSQALENYDKTIKKLRITPTDDFLNLGVEHFHQLSDKHRRLLMRLKKVSDEIQFEAIPRMLSGLIEGLPSRKCDSCGKDVIIGFKFCPHCGKKMLFFLLSLLLSDGDTQTLDYFDECLLHRHYAVEKRSIKVEEDS